MYHQNSFFIRCSKLRLVQWRTSRSIMEVEWRQGPDRLPTTMTLLLAFVEHPGGITRTPDLDRSRWSEYMVMTVHNLTFCDLSPSLRHSRRVVRGMCGASARDSFSDESAMCFSRLINSVKSMRRQTGKRLRRLFCRIWGRA